MRKLYLLLALFGTNAIFAQETKPQRNAPANVEFSEVVRADSFPSAQLYFNAKLFVNSVFHNVRETAQIRDDKTQSVATKGSFPVTIENASGEEIKAKTFFTLVIQARENVYKYVINDLYFAYTEETGITSYASFNDRLGVAMTKKQWQQVEDQTNVFVKAFIQDLKEQMLQKDLVCKEVLQANKKKKEKKF